MLNLLTIIDACKCKLSCIAGHFSIDLLKCDSHASYKFFLNNMLAHSYCPSISKPTRVSNSSASLIDNIFMKSNTMNFTSAIIYRDISDHFPIIVQLELHDLRPKNPCNNLKKRSCSDVSINKFITLLETVDWDCFIKEHEKTNDPNLSYIKFSEIYKNLYDEIFPLKNVLNASSKIKPRQGWITMGLAKSCDTKAKLFKKYKKNPTIINEIKYRVYRNKLKALLIKAEKSYYENKFKMCSDDLRQSWKILNSMLNRNTTFSQQSMFKIDDANCTNPNQIVDKFNSYFTSIGPDLASKISVSKFFLLLRIKESLTQCFYHLHV